MINPFSYLLELIGVRKVIRFVQLQEFELSEKTSEIEIRKILEKSPSYAQFHLGMPYKIEDTEHGCQLALIQRVPKNKEYFFICNMGSHWSTQWEKKHIDHIVKLIMENRNNQCTELELWKLAKRAIEGKRFGEY